ncbi:cell division protein ZapA [Galbibacter sp.]|uniref:cell division protein ZapA n=1 Tax=Galbibacter sp. TaxID=2918471 RepID=UPI002BB97001|nr:cell division protein ZapA [Galbibacter sp.]HLV62070.1 cell division protein ZapA [Galbibacter sp.]
MANTLKIKISIADRVYPLTIMPEQEEGLRKAAKTIDQLIKQFEKNYAVRDKQDVLAMCALQFASQVEQKSIDKEITNEQTKERLSKLNDLLLNHL